VAPLPRLMLVTDRARAGGLRLLCDAVARAARAGPLLVQVREPDLGDPALEDLLRDLVRATAGSAAVLVVNGRPAVARERGLGLHLPEDAPGTAAARARRAGGVPCLGRSVHSTQAARTALAEPLDYLVFGHVWDTPSKAGRPGRGLAELARVAEAAPLPVFAIGGVSVVRVRDAIDAGAHGVAVSRAILGAADPGAATAMLLRALERAGSAQRC